MITSLIGVLAGVLMFAKVGVMLKSLRLANDPATAVSDRGVVDPFDMVTHVPETLVPVHPLLKLIGVNAEVPTML